MSSGKGRLLICRRSFEVRRKFGEARKNERTWGIVHNAGCSRRSRIDNRHNPDPPPIFHCAPSGRGSAPPCRASKSRNFDNSWIASLTVGPTRHGDLPAGDVARHTLNFAGGPTISAIPSASPGSTQAHPRAVSCVTYHYVAARLSQHKRKPHVNSLKYEVTQRSSLIGELLKKSSTRGIERARKRFAPVVN